jgi:hypothetical protein
MHAALVPITNAETSKGFSIVDFTAPCYFVASGLGWAGALLLVVDFFYFVDLEDLCMV